MAYVVGQEAVMVRSGSWDCTYIFVTVNRVTPSGRVEVKTSSGSLVMFDKKGYEMGETYRKASLREDVAYIKDMIAKRNARDAAARALNKAKIEDTVRDNWSRETMLVALSELKAKVAEAEALVNAIPV